MAQVAEAGTALAQQVLSRDLDVLEGELGGVLGLQADLLQRAGLGVALHAVLNDEQGDAGAALLWVGDGDDDGEVCLNTVGDEGLRAVDGEGAVAVVAGQGADASQVGAGLRLGHGDCGDLLTGAQRLEEALLLLVISEALQVWDDQVVDGLDAHDDGAGVRLSELLGQHGVETVVVHSAAAPLLFDLHAQQAHVAGLLEHLAVNVALVVPALHVRADFGLHEATDGLAEHLVLFVEQGAGKVVLHVVLSGSRGMFGERACTVRAVIQNS